MISCIRERRISNAVNLNTEVCPSNEGYDLRVGPEGASILIWKEKGMMSMQRKRWGETAVAGVIGMFISMGTGRVFLKPSLS